MRVLEYILRITERRKAHFTLLDPAELEPKQAAELAEHAIAGGTDAVMVGGSAGVDRELLDECVRAIRVVADEHGKPVILFPGDVSGISKHAHAIFFMSLLNSRNPYYITGAQAIGAHAVKRSGIEPVPMGYIVVEPGGAVGWVGDAKLIPRSKPELAAGYALAAEYLGMRLVYLEAGSGAESPVPAEMVRLVKNSIGVPLIVGGGIRSAEDARATAKAGADVVVTGTAVEGAEDAEERVREFVRAIREL